MTIEDFQLLAWLRVGEAVASIVLYVTFILGITKVYRKAGVSFGGFRLVLKYFFILKIITLGFAMSNFFNSLTKPEETMQQYIEQQSRGTSDSLFDVPKELITGEKSSA